MKEAEEAIVSVKVVVPRAAMVCIRHSYDFDSMVCRLVHPFGGSTSARPGGLHPFDHRLPAM